MPKADEEGGDTFPFPQLVGDLYARWTLDCLVEIGFAVSMDFIARPQLYLSDDIPAEIVDLRIAWGTDPRFPNTAQRQAMLLPIFGRSDGLSLDAAASAAPFHMARKKFIDACIAFSERAVDTGIAMLLDRVRSALVPLRAHLDGLNGQSFRLTAQQIQDLSDTVIGILRAAEVAKVFGVSPADARWPFDSVDPNGAKLVENVGLTLSLPPECKLSYTRFILLQRVAQEGGRTLPRSWSPTHLRTGLARPDHSGLHLGHVTARLPASLGKSTRQILSLHWHCMGGGPKLLRLAAGVSRARRPVSAVWPATRPARPLASAWRGSNLARCHSPN